MPTPSTAELNHYFEYSSAGIQVEKDGLQEMTFGEYLVDKSAISRHDLLRALQLQDQHPGVRLGECVAALGIMPYSTIETHLASWNKIGTIEA